MTNKKISYLARAIVLGVMFCSAPLYAETVFVVGSYNNSAKAETVRLQLSTRLNVPVHIVSATVANALVYRLYVRGDQFSEDTALVVQEMGIEPWRLSLDLPTQEPKDEATVTAEILVASLASIDEALALERRLAAEGLTVAGKTELVAGQIVHQVWLKGLSSKQAQIRLGPLGLKQLAVRAVAGESDPGKSNQDSSVMKSGKATAEQAAKASEQPVRQAKRYPKDFNLARLPEKKSQ